MEEASSPLNSGSIVRRPAGTLQSMARSVKLFSKDDKIIVSSLFLPLPSSHPFVSPGRPRRSHSRGGDTMGARAAAGALSVVLILGLGLSPTALACPQPCACYLPTEVHCTFRSLAAVPARISKHVERINFGFVWRFCGKPFYGLGAESWQAARTWGAPGPRHVLFKWNCRDGWLLAGAVFQTRQLLAWRKF